MYVHVHPFSVILWDGQRNYSERSTASLGAPLVGLVCVDKLKRHPRSQVQVGGNAGRLEPVQRLKHLSGLLQQGHICRQQANICISTKWALDLINWRVLFTIRVVHLRVQRRVVLVAACRRPSVWRRRSCSTCVLQNPGRGWGWGWGGGWGRWYRVDHSRLWLLLLFEVRRPRGASLWRCSMLPLRQHYLDSRLSRGWGSTAADSLLVWGQSHLDSFHHDRHRLAGHTMIPTRCGGQRKVKIC